MAEYEKYRKLAEENKLPSNFDRWELSCNDGHTVAHIQASRHGIPSNFDQWELADNNGWTVAHVQAMWHGIPSNFDQWELADNNGWTVAHSQAMWHGMPHNFDQWELADNNGRTVRDVWNRKYIDLGVENMRNKEFEGITKKTLENVGNKLTHKNKEYADADNKFHNFDRAAEIMKCTREEALKGFMTKHIVSVFDMIEGYKHFSKEIIDEKIEDTIAYLVILKAMLYNRDESK